MSNMLTLLGRPRWWERAACRGRLELLSRFVPGTGGQRRRERVPDDLKAMCKHCPVSRECLADVLAFDGQRRHYDGGPDMSIRAGTTPGERLGLTARR